MYYLMLTSAGRYLTEGVSRAALQERHEFAWLPFGAGARGCLGRRLGVTEATVGAAYLIKLFDYRFERIDKPLKFTYDLTLNLQGSCKAEVLPKASVV